MPTYSANEIRTFKNNILVRKKKSLLKNVEKSIFELVVEYLSLMGLSDIVYM